MHAVRQTYAGLWTATAVGILAASVAGVYLQRVGAPFSALRPSAATAANLLVTNALVAMWPLALAGLRWHELPGVRGTADALVVGHLLAQGLLVGGALGQRPQLWRYLPHLPLEWLGIALPAAGWLLARRGHTCGRAVLRLAMSSIAVLALAAIVETWAVPL